MDAWSEEDMNEEEDVSEDDNEKNGELLMEYYYSEWICLISINVQCCML